MDVFSVQCYLKQVTTACFVDNSLYRTDMCVCWCVCVCTVCVDECLLAAIVHRLRLCLFANALTFVYLSVLPLPFLTLILIL